MKLRFALIALMAVTASTMTAAPMPEPTPDISEDVLFIPALQAVDLDASQTFVIEAVNHDAGIVLVQAPDAVPDTADNRFTALFAKADEAFNNSIHAPELERLCMRTLYNTGLDRVLKRSEYELLCMDRLMIKVYEGNRYRLEATPPAWLKPEKPKSNFHK